MSGPLKELLNYTTGITFEGFAAAESQSLPLSLIHTCSLSCLSLSLSRTCAWTCVHLSHVGIVSLSPSLSHIFSLSLSLSLSQELNCSFYMSSFVEDKGQNFIKTQARDFVKYTQRQNSRVYPNGSRINSSNYMPQVIYFLYYACQIINSSNQ